MTATELRAWRERMGWTQKEAAEAMGMKLRSYQQIEQGRRSVQPYHARLVALLEG